MFLAGYSILLRCKVRCRFTNRDSRLLWCCKGHQALKVPAVHVNGPTGAELKGILSAAPPCTSDSGQQENAMVSGAMGISRVT
jgi:hypothetical protein